MCSNRNHFIEVDTAIDGTKYLIIHSGSRNLGKQVAELYQGLAVDLQKGKEKYFKQKEKMIAKYKEIPFQYVHLASLVFYFPLQTLDHIMSESVVSLLLRSLLQKQRLRFVFLQSR
mgnify:CR=1 FL=1